MKTLKEFNPRSILKEKDKSQVKVFKDSLSVNLILIYKDVRFLIFDNGQVFYDGINYAEQQYEIEDSAFWGENGIENGFKFTREEGIELIKRFKNQEIENYSEKMSFEEFYKMKGDFYYEVHKTKEKLSIVVVEDDEEVLECSLYSGSKDISILKDFRNENNSNIESDFFMFDTNRGDPISTFEKYEDAVEYIEKNIDNL